jgi:hypothetical protein
LTAFLQRGAGAWFAVAAALAACRAPRELDAERARSAPPAASSSDPTAALPVAPAPRAAAASAPLPDSALLPCNGFGVTAVRCAPRDMAVARGALGRAREYLQSCRECRERAAVEKLIPRLEAHIARSENERTIAGFRAAMKNGARDEAAQLLADARSDINPVWQKTARRWLKDNGRPNDDASCKLGEGNAALISPRRPGAGERVRVLLAVDRLAPTAHIELIDPDGNEQASFAVQAGNGPPAWRAIEFEATRAGQHRVELRDERGLRIACRRVGIARMPQAKELSASDVLWPSVRGWEPADEMLYSAFIERLFSDREGRRFQGLAEVLRDPTRNVLFDHNGRREDAELSLSPDCADAPYFFRAYFAYKLGLPFGFHDCRAGSDGVPPRCDAWTTNLSSTEQIQAVLPDFEPPSAPDPIASVNRFLRALKELIVARSLRTSLRAEGTDLYPVALERASLRPGTVFSDPYGHTLTVVRWEAPTEKRPGKLVAVDAQPDGTLGIKRFWRGTFLFTSSDEHTGYGFKAFRPIVLDEEGAPRLLSNAELSAANGFVGPSLEQSGISANEFYERVESIVRPEHLAPEVELEALVEALLEQLRSRAEAIEISEELLRERRRGFVDMPRGREIFHAHGAWESLSTPCRDLRLLVGMDIVDGFASDQPALRARLEPRLRELVERAEFQYWRSDGSLQRLTVAEALRRKAALEMGYNPNDCPELRWGAPQGSKELSSCARTASSEQRRRMDALRYWFQRRYACG